MAIVLFVCQFNVSTGAAQSVIGIEFIFDIVPDTSTLTNLPSTGNLPGESATFTIRGKIYPFRTVNQADCTFRTTSPRQLGTWRAWGTVSDEGRLVVNQSLTLDYINGSIEVQGTTGVLLGNGPAGPAIQGTRGEPLTGPTEVLSVTGGAGAYRGLNGCARFATTARSAYRSSNQGATGRITAQGLHVTGRRAKARLLSFVATGKIGKRLCAFNNSAGVKNHSTECIFMSGAISLCMGKHLRSSLGAN
jgi:hypothetical protein